MNPVRRRAAFAAPLLLAPLLLTACSSGAAPAGSGSGSGTSASSGSAASSTGAAAKTGSGIYDKYDDDAAAFCALVSPADATAATKATPAYVSAKVAVGSSTECSYDNGTTRGFVSVALSPAGDGSLDDITEIDKTVHPATVKVGGLTGRYAQKDLQVVVGDAAIDVLGISDDEASKAALAAAFVAKLQ